MYITINKNSADGVQEHRIMCSGTCHVLEHICVLVVNTGATDVLVLEFEDSLHRNSSKSKTLE